MTGHGEESSLEQYQIMKASELYPKKQIKPDDTGLQVPFPELKGESVEFLGRTTDGVIALSNFRLFVRFKDSFVNVPLGLIESVEYRDIFFIYICCKDAHSFRCTFATNEVCLEWYKRLCVAVNPPQKLTDAFCFAFYAHCKDSITDGKDYGGTPICRLVTDPQTGRGYSFDREVARLGIIDGGKNKEIWRITYINQDFKLCGSYPKFHIVPTAVEDEVLESAASFRGSKRFPSVVWRDKKSGAVICRSSQPEVGWLGWRNQQDEGLIAAIAAACLKDRNTTSNAGIDEAAVQPGEEASTAAVDSAKSSKDPRKMLILDARSYAAAVANRAKGGGCECIEYYPNCEIQFMSLANIHTIRKSFHAIRTLCSTAGDQPGWLQGIETTKWLHHISGMLKAALTVVTAIDKESRPVLVHCSDGWDRTPQIVALAEIMLDSYYRTIEGFRVLVEREWLEFGHKFADRCGIGKGSDDTNERCPVFLQFLDCVHQLLVQNPCSFQFNQAYLVKLAQHTYSNLFGTFLCNNTRDRVMNKVPEQASSVWSLLSLRNRQFVNLLYIPQHNQILEPSWYLKDLCLWRSVYMSKIAPSAALEEPEEITSPTPEDSSSALPPSEDLDKQMLPKTRSCENLLSVSGDYSQSTVSSGNRRLSDPNIKADPNLLVNGGVVHATATTATTATATNVVDNKRVIINEDESTVKYNNLLCTTTESSDTLVADNSPPQNSSFVHRMENSCSQTDDGNDVQAASAVTVETAASSISDENLNKDEDCDKTPQCSIIMDSPLSNDHQQQEKEHLKNDNDDIITNSLPEVHNNILTKSQQVSCEGSDSNEKVVDSEEENGFGLQNNPEESSNVISSQPVACNGYIGGINVVTAVDKLTDDVETNDGDNKTKQTQIKNNITAAEQTSQNSSPAAVVTNGCINDNDKNNTENDSVPLQKPIENSNNIIAIKAANISTSTSDISDSHVDIDFKSRLIGLKNLRPCANKVDETLLGLDMGAVTLAEKRSNNKKHLYVDLSGTGGNGAFGSRESSHGSVMSSEIGSQHGGASGGNSSIATESPSPSSDKMSGYWISRQVQGVTRFLDMDGLQTYDDPVHKRTLQIMSMYQEHIRHMEEKLHTAKSLLYHYTSGRNGTGGKPHHTDSDTQSESESDDHEASLGGRSDVSYEMVGEDDAFMTLWVPDHAVTHCTGCDREFWIVRRRHHCRNCGKVYCSTCAPHYVPVPQQHLPNPVRVCRNCYMDIDFDPVEESYSSDKEADLAVAMRELEMEDCLGVGGLGGGPLTNGRTPAV